MMRRTLLFVFVIMMVLPQVAHGKTLSYWYSNLDKIGNDSNRYIWSNVIDGFTVSDFTSYQDYARDQWSSDAGISTYGADEKASSSIHWYGGNQSTLREMEPSLEVYRAVCVPEYLYLIGNHTYNGTTKENWRMKSKIYTPKLPWYYGFSNYNLMFTHELGHGLGWLGHSSNSGDLMNADASNDTLSTRDINHLQQNY
ncbi:matrixin family metalloprotease [Bacillus salitolerans]|uniref:Matrixin family metalloprotease n=1 Tax=Bacillus salitolerans TaxID=1437434 RepID=A0ABW4LM83_9BACI